MTVATISKLIHFYMFLFRLPTPFLLRRTNRKTFRQLGCNLFPVGKDTVCFLNKATVSKLSQISVKRTCSNAERRKQGALREMLSACSQNHDPPHTFFRAKSLIYLHLEQ